MSKTNRSVILNETIPSGQPVPPDAFSIQESVIPELADGQVLLRPIAFSVDPVQRTLLAGAREAMMPSYVPGKPIVNFAVARVVASRRDDVKVGALIQGRFDWSDYVVWDGKTDIFTQAVDPKIPKVSNALSISGITGLPAYFGMIEVGQVQPGETVVVSSAAGAVGSVAGKIAKIRGAKKLGLDVALNFRADDFAEQLRAATSGKIDLYFDSVGGQLSQIIMKQMKRPARVVECGQIATYDDNNYAWVVNISPIHMNGLRLEGFQPMLFHEKWPEAFEQLRKWVESGELVAIETESKGLESLPGALTALMKGENTGKAIVTIDE
ncbi:hypothetical protein AYO20_09441 [Fonsecaea nubica]|uniref:Enoyl reductase (ER) domain-containing protein n=1 Tax=Fonsecaea nubica TaxID=856822 RepID=A0A178CHI6_9EURO|nr:hypothetical protein AYO20_09441 [Fonsecaea nubica]OAL28493.1 hypothetical protein AYO20_09441 [Fonsecaea nubica]